MNDRGRTVRVFISSTFRDMQAEREELVKRVFPQVRKLCNDRGVTFTDVDLRWGVTEAQAERGEVLPVCLAQIDRCRPYFIGLLGERYGTVADAAAISDELIRQRAWPAEYRRRSLTELEIIHGVLDDPGMANRACFYFRDSSYLQTLSPQERAHFAEETPEAHTRLEALKDRIRRSGLAVRENYPDPRALGDLVLRDLIVAINQAFPAGERPGPLDLEAAGHEAFALSRTGVYLGRDENIQRLDGHAAAEDDGPGLVVLGESGSGKSALLANWAVRHRELHPNDSVLMHFIGASPYSADWSAMVRRIMGELKRRYQLEPEIPDNPDELRAAFANWLHMAAARVPEGRRVILILDALNQLDDRQGAPDLLWLPPTIPGRIRLIVSTLPGRPRDELTRRQWPALTVEPFTPAERRQFITRYLEQYAKALDGEPVERIAGAAQAGNPLFLQALLEELRLFGAHERLDDRIDDCLAATTVAELYECILARYEDDYQRDRPGLVRDAMTLLWAARRGLSESELLDVLGDGEQPLPQAHWSPLFLAAEASLVSRSGSIGFFHDYLREAVQSRYVRTRQEQAAAHLRLADYFQERDLDARKVDELPWQLAEAGAWQRLADLLTEVPFFLAAWRADLFDVEACWARIEAGSSLRLADAYQGVCADPAPNTDCLWAVATLVNDAGYPSKALELTARLIELLREAGDQSVLSAALRKQAWILWDRGNLDDAMKLFKGAEQLCRELDNKHGLQNCIGGQAVILRDRGDLHGAMVLHKEEERICRELGNKYGLMASLNNQAVILRHRGDLHGAMRLYKEAERICRELGDKSGLGSSLHNQAVILRDRGDLGAMSLFKADERIRRELGDKNGLQATLGSQALVHHAGGDLDGAMRLLKEQERICRELGNKYWLQESLSNQAVILRRRGDLDGAMRLFKEAELICRELENVNGLAISLANQAALLIWDLKKPEEALPLAERAHRLCSDHGLIGLVDQVKPTLNAIRARLDRVS